MNLKDVVSIVIFIVSYTCFSQQWQQNFKVVQPERTASSAFGLFVSIYEGFAAYSANSVDVGAVNNAGKVYIARQECEEWSIYQEITLSQTEDYCGFGGALVMDETTLAITGCDPLNPRGGNAVYIYKRAINDNYVLEQKIAKPEDVLWDGFGSQISISGDYMVVGASNNSTDESMLNFIENAGAAYIYHRDGIGLWSMVQKITASDRGRRHFFGGSVDIDDTTIVIGSKEEGAIRSGAAYVFEKNSNSNTWQETAKLVANDFRARQDRFGGVVSIDKNMIAVGAMGDDDYDNNDSGDGGGPLTLLGSVYIFKKNTNGNWLVNQKLRPSETAPEYSFFSERLDMNEGKLAVRGRMFDFDATGNPIAMYGKIYMFEKDSSDNWNEYQIVEQDIMQNSDWFGVSISLSEENMFIGAYWHDYDANEENFINDSGAVYIFNTHDIPKKPELNELPVLTACEDLGAGISSRFDTSQLENDLIDDVEDYIFTYKDENGNNLPSPLPVMYTNSIPFTETIFVNVQNKYNPKCFDDIEIELQVLSPVQLNEVLDIFACDTNNNGYASFDTGMVESTLLGGQTGVIIEYFDETENALPNPLPNPYINSTAFQETITARLTNTLTGCYDETTFDLIVSAVPIANPLETLIGCDNNNDGISEYIDTSLVESELLGAQTGMEVTYYDGNGILLPSPLPNPFTNTEPYNQDLTIRVANSETGCFVETVLSIQTSTQPIINKPQTLYACDEGNGIATFVTSTIESQLIGNQSGLEIFYSDQNGNSLPSPLPLNFQNTAPYLQTINVRVEHSLNSLCYAETTLDLIVNELLTIDLDANYFICNLDQETAVSISPDYDTYEWQFEDGTSISNTNIATLVYEGDYTINVTRLENGIVCNNSFNFHLTRSVLPVIETVNYDELGNNFIEIIATGDGDFEYSIDGVNYQNSNYFNNVLGGTYTVYIRDKEGCGEDSRLINLIDYPKFFTPNSDGYHDYWQIYGIRSYPGAIIYIFDRYGKLLKQLSPMGKGWDGTYKGNLLPATDYWFTLKLNNGRTFQDHFALKR